MQRERSDAEEVTLAVLFRSMPVQSGLFTVGPLVLALAQLANSAVTSLSVPYALAFAVMMLGFSMLSTRYHLAKFRLRTLHAVVEG